jgi:hypothetical protein
MGWIRDSETYPSYRIQGLKMHQIPDPVNRSALYLPIYDVNKFTVKSSGKPHNDSML